MFSQSVLLNLSVSSNTYAPRLWSPKHELKIARQKNMVASSSQRRMKVLCNAAMHHEQPNVAGIKIPTMKVKVPAAELTINDHVVSIKSIFKSMGAGDINKSPYDTAWVALIKHVDGNNADVMPQFPSCLEWIANHQHPDGSWGDKSFFSAQDRIINTLACVIALKSWNVYPDKLLKGISFIKENMCKLEDGITLNCFQVVFPALLDMADELSIEVDSTLLLQGIKAKRKLKLDKIPYELLHSVPTTLLHSLEGMVGLDWNKLLKLQFKDGSFLLSPSSTAFAFMQTKDENCLSYLQNIVQKFDGGVPYMYNVELFEKIWMVDRLQRLGISRHFQTEIKECLLYVYKHWNDKGGIGMGRYCEVVDIDDTCMGFRLLRLHGFHVSPDVFRHFEDGEEFVCYKGQLKQGVTDTFNLFRASQLMFPGETILQKAKNFSFNFLKQKQASNQLSDKWLITKDLPGEVGYALDVPWYANLPHVETRFYIEQYGGDDDVWIGKTLYRVPYVSNNKYLELAKQDFKQCQAQHQLEWRSIQKWYADSDFGDFGISREEVLLQYFLAAATIFEPERSNERMSWAKTAVLMKITAYYFTDDETTCERQDKMNFINKFTNNEPNKETNDGLVSTLLLKTINELSVTDGTDIHKPAILEAWAKWIKSLHEESDDGYTLGEAELIIQTLYHCSESRCDSQKPFTSSDHKHLLHVTNSVCNKLRRFQDQKMEEKHMNERNEIEDGMQELVQLVYQNSMDNVHDDDDSYYIKKACLAIAKTYYYTAYCEPEIIDTHITKVLFERVE